jgi:hypothetical protein
MVLSVSLGAGSTSLDAEPLKRNTKVSRPGAAPAIARFVDKAVADAVMDRVVAAASVDQVVAAMALDCVPAGTATEAIGTIRFRWHRR